MIQWVKCFAEDEAVYFLLSRSPPVTLSQKQKRLIIQDLVFMKPCWAGQSIGCCAGYWDTCTVNNFYSPSRGVLVRSTGSKFSVTAFGQPLVILPQRPHCLDSLVFRLCFTCPRIAYTPGWRWSQLVSFWCTGAHHLVYPTCFCLVSPVARMHPPLSTHLWWNAVICLALRLWCHPVILKGASSILSRRSGFCGLPRQTRLLIFDELSQVHYTEITCHSEANPWLAQPLDFCCQLITLPKEMH